MVACDDIHCSSWYNHLYLYCGSWPMCYHSNARYNNNYPDHTGICSDRAALPEQYGSDATCYINQWNNWFMVTCDDIHFSSWYNHLYLYGGSWPMCYHSNAGYNN